jgi:tight adherence protein C
VFGAVALVGFFVSKMMVGDVDSGKLRNRLSDRKATEAQVSITKGADKNGGVLPMLQKVGQAAAEPFMPKTRESQGAIRQKMGKAGIYNASAAKVMKGAQVILMAGGTLGGLYIDISAGKFMGATAAGGLLGYLIPTLVLRQLIKKNQQALTYGLADALDLMVVCVEAGLTVDAAMQRVGSEMSIAHPAISREFSITHMETRVGLPRMDALKNMGSRTGCAALVSLSSMLIQADRFGTSIAQALRVHADTLRVNRQHAAEEMAAKASVKMTFPLVLFIFPATFIVLAGPTVIGLMNSALFK